MSAVISTPVEWVQSISDLRLPESADRRLQTLMDKNTEGFLTSAEQEELSSLVDLSERLSLLRAEALHLLQGAAA